MLFLILMSWFGSWLGFNATYWKRDGISCIDLKINIYLFSMTYNENSKEFMLARKLLEKGEIKGNQPVFKADDRQNDEAGIKKGGGGTKVFPCRGFFN